MGEDRAAFADQPRPERNDDWLILSGIRLVLRVGRRWVDCPNEHGLHKTIYNRFARWSARGIWQKIFAAVAAPSKPPNQAALDLSHVKAHRCASGRRDLEWYFAAAAKADKARQIFNGDDDLKVRILVFTASAELP